MARERKDYPDRIVQNPATMAGKPGVKGTRIPVEKVAAQLAYKPDLEELFAIHPGLTIEEGEAYWAYAQAAVSTSSWP